MTDVVSQRELCLSVSVIPPFPSDNQYTPTLSAVGLKHKRCRCQIKARTRMRRLKR